AELSGDDLNTVMGILATANNEDARQVLTAIHQGAIGDVPVEVWERLVAQLPLEDQGRLAGVNTFFRALVARVAPQALVQMTPQGPVGGPQRGHVRTIYTQSELEASLDEAQQLVFTPGQGSDLTINRRSASGQAVTLEGPYPLTTVTTGGTVNANGQVTITTVTDGGTVIANGQVTITTVTDGGTVIAYDKVTITAVTGGNVEAYDKVTVTDVSGGTVHAYDDVTVTCSAGGTVIVYGPDVTVRDNGGTID
ncbi:MAG: hypothetical protein H0T78_04940, partial [Longispora sp.]|nr:hypothetical protein [Longispora sp. (in: high G+C Gram-positive bacteria)]